MCGVRPKNFSGSVGVTIGDGMSATFGAQHAHVFGPHVTLVCDLEDMIMEHAPIVKRLPVVSGLLAGIGGNVNWVYGSSTNALYIGPKYDIRRAKSIEKHSENIIPHSFYTDPDTGKDVESEDCIDFELSLVVGIASVVMCLVAAILDLIMSFKYQDLQDAKQREDSGQEEHYEKLVEGLKVWSYSLTGRLMAELRLLEEKGTLVGIGEQWTLEGKFVGAVAKFIVFAPFSMSTTWVERHPELSIDNLTKAVDDSYQWILQSADE